MEQMTREGERERVIGESRRGSRARALKKTGQIRKIRKTPVFLRQATYARRLRYPYPYRYLRYAANKQTRKIGRQDTSDSQHTPQPR